MYSIREVDLYAPKAPEMSDMINGAFGELSPFQNQFGFSVDGVSANTAPTRRPPPLTALSSA